MAAFVEVAWRWRAAVELLRASPGPQYTAPAEEHERRLEEIEESCQIFLARMTTLDSTMGDADLNSVWVQNIVDNL